MPTTPLEQLTKLAAGFDKETLTKEDFLAAFKKVTELVKRIKKGQDEANTALDGRVNEFSQATLQRLEQALTELTAKVDSAFVGDVMTRLEGEQNTRMGTVESKLKEATELLALIEKGKQGDPGAPGNPGRDGSPDKVDQILTKLNATEESIAPSVIIGLEAFFKELDRKLRRFAEARVHAGPNANAVLVHDASSQCDGENKTFTMPMARIVRAVHCTQFPFFYRPTVDFTIGNRNIELTAEVAAPESGQSLFIDYVK